MDPTPPVRSTPPDPPEELLERAAFLSDEEVQSQLETGSARGARWSGSLGQSPVGDG